ncbi:uncharacterized protein LOC110239757 [Exaiptasia diaphana]|uniref:Uncharacterized protein n=1 Tax=Exaiptasia diaphana TaxID=2652724 RepID=A0A913X9H7_EXADI|nr:uncharacterized protein LOC110239757 [Exaiptasia diaphana]
MNLALVAATAVVDNAFSLARFGVRHVDKRLRCGIFKTLAAHHVDCQELCADTLNCFSTNTYKNGTDVCELVRGTKNSFDDKECFEKKDGGIHSELSSTNFGNTLRKALPDGWFQLGSSAFKFIPTQTRTTVLEANATCIANQAEVVLKFQSALHKQFVFAVFPEADKYHEVREMGPTKIWKLDGLDSDVKIYGGASYQEDDDTIDAVLELPGTAGSYATTPKFALSQVNFTISFWIKSSDFSPFTTADTSPQVYSSWGNPHVFAITPNMFTARKVYLQRGTRFKVTHGRGLPTNQWVNIVAIWNRYSLGEGLASMYINGEKVGQELVTDNNPKGVGFPNPPVDVFDIGYNRETAAVMKGKLRGIVAFLRPLYQKDINELRDALDHRFPKVICRKQV